MDQSVWDCLNKPSADGPLLSSCGAELQELMRQIDIMVRNKKMEWEAELISVQDCLTLKEQELTHTRALLEQKHQEIGVMKHQLDGYENGQKSVISQYEAQLNKVKKQMTDLKEAHEKMQKQKNKKLQSFTEKEKQMAEEIEHLNLQLKEKKVTAVQHEKESSEWDISKRALQHQIECLEKQKRALASNYERAQQQLSVAQSRLKKSNRMVEEMEGTSQSLLQKLEEELANDKELIQRQERMIADLQAKNRDLSSARHALSGEKYKYQEQADKAACKLKVVEEEVSRLEAALSARETALRGSDHETEAQRSKIANLQSALQTKEKIIEAMQVRSPLKNKDEDVRVKVTQLEAALETMRENENKFREEIRSLEGDLKSSRNDAEQLKRVLKRSEHAKVNDLNEEISQLRIKLGEMENQHSVQLCGIKDDVTKLSSHLRGRDANIDRLSDTCAEMERRLRDEALRREQLNAELQTASTHLTALRIQRKSASREQGMETGSTDRSLTEAESQLSDLRQNYGKAVSRLEEENEELKSQISHLKRQLQEADPVSDPFLPTESSGGKQSGDNKMADVVRQYEQRIATLEARLRGIDDPNLPLPATSCSSVVLRSTEGVLTPRSEVTDTPRSEVTESYYSGSGGAPSSPDDVRTPTPTKTFLRSIGIDPSSSAAASLCSRGAPPGSIDEKQLQALLGLGDEACQDGGFSGIDQYAVEEEQRVLELESRIEDHIGAMQRAMEAAMAKYK